MVGIHRLSAYLPKLRLQRSAIHEAHRWLAPGLASQSTGERTLAFWDEDAVTMGVEAARRVLDQSNLSKDKIDKVIFASTTAPFSDRKNASIIHAALQLPGTCQAIDMGGAHRAGLEALHCALEESKTSLVVAADRPVARAASVDEMVYSDGASAAVISSDDPILELIGSASTSVDFVDHYRQSNQRFGHKWEDRWVREEGYLKIMPPIVGRAIESAGISPDQIDYFIMPCPIANVGVAVAKACAIGVNAHCDYLYDVCGDIGTGHAALMMANAIEKASVGGIVLLAQFGQGASVLVFRVTAAIANASANNVRKVINHGVKESNYSKLLIFNDLLPWERGMRSEADTKTALSVSHRYNSALMGLVGSRCRETGVVQFPPSAIGVDGSLPEKGTYDPYPLADKGGRVSSHTLDALAYSMHPPSCYGLVDINGGGRLMMDFTDVDAAEIREGYAVRFCFRIKDFDHQRGFRRYFWKAVREEKNSGEE